jgi:hypothetical protein
MNTIISSQLSRSFLVAGLAFAGTLLSFSATTAPARAGTNHYNAKLSTAVAAPKDKVVNGVVWKCAADTCGGAVDGARPLNTCIHVVKAFGKVQSFTGPKGDFSAEDLERCNAAA